MRPSARRARCARRAHRRGRRRPVATFPGRDRAPVPHWAAALENGPLRRRAAGGGRRPGPVPRRGRGRARRRRLRAARGRRRSHGRGRGDPRAPFHYGDVDDALASADLVVRTTFRVPRFTGLPVECYGVVCDWDEPAGRLTAWANFQGPFTLHGVAAAALGSAGPASTPHAARLGGFRRQGGGLLPYVVLVGLAARALGVPVRWTGDRMEHLAASWRRPKGHRGRGRVLTRRRARGASLRRARGRRRLRAGPEPATLYRMHGSLSGAYRVRNVAARNRVVLTNTVPPGLNRGFGGPQLYFGARADDGDRGPQARDRSGRARAAQPGSGRRDAVPHGDGRPLRLGRLRGLSRARGRARALRRTARRGPRPAPRAGSSGIGLACVVEPSISNMGYISLAQTAERARGDAAEVGERRRRHGRDRPARRDHRAARRRRRRARGIGTVSRRSSRTPRLHPEEISVHSELDTTTTPGRWRPGTTRRGSPASASGRRRPPPAAPAGEGRRSCAAHLEEPDMPLRRVAGTVHWHPEGLPDGMEPGLAAVAFFATPNLDPPDAEDRVSSSGGARLGRRRVRGRGRPCDGRGDRYRLRERPRRRHALEPDARGGSGAWRLRARRRRGAVRAPRLRR